MSEKSKTKKNRFKVIFHEHEQPWDRFRIYAVQKWWQKWSLKIRINLFRRKK